MEPMTAQQRANGSISLSEATAVSLGTIIGAGIFILSGSAIRLAGPSAVTSFILTAFCALLIALNTSELSSRIQKRGAIYSFTREALGDFYGFLVGWMRIASYIVGGAAVALGFSSYLLRILGLDLWLEPYLAGLLIAFLTALNLAGVRPTVRMEFILVSFNVAALITFIATGLLLSKHPISRQE